MSDEIRDVSPDKLIEYWHSEAGEFRAPLWNDEQVEHFLTLVQSRFPAELDPDEDTIMCALALEHSLHVTRALQQLLFDGRMRAVDGKKGTADRLNADDFTFHALERPGA